MEARQLHTKPKPCTSFFQISIHFIANSNSCKYNQSKWTNFCPLAQASLTLTSQTPTVQTTLELSSMGMSQVVLLRILLTTSSYVPNFTLCILGIVFFTLAFFAHSIQVLIYRHWSFALLTLATLMEVIGYAFRALSSRKDPYRITYFIVEYFLIVTAPVLFSASIYVCLTKIIAWAEQQGIRLSEKGWYLRKKVILWTFISIDVVTTVMQVLGASLIGHATSKQKDPSTANNILLSGLAIQTFAFAIFLVLLTIVIYAICGDGESIGRLRSSKSPFLGVLMISSLLVFVRTIFRLVETSQGVFGHLSTHEGYFTALEFAPVVVAVWLLAVWFPGRWPTRKVRSKVEG